VDNNFLADKLGFSGDPYTKIEAGLRSPLRNPASAIGRLATTKLNSCSGFYWGRIALSPSQPGLNYRSSRDNQTQFAFWVLSRPDCALPFATRPQLSVVSRQPNSICVLGL